MSSSGLLNASALMVIGDEYCHNDRYNRVQRCYFGIEIKGLFFPSLILMTTNIDPRFGPVMGIIGRNRNACQMHYVLGDCGNFLRAFTSITYAVDIPIGALV